MVKRESKATGEECRERRGEGWRCKGVAKRPEQFRRVNFDAAGRHTTALGHMKAIRARKSQSQSCKD